MAQIFSPSADTRLRVIVFVVAAGAAGALVFAGESASSAYVTQVGWPRDQPVPFSHKHHVGELGLDCRYCHTSVETGRHAGLPETRICMTCHSQLWTNAGMLAPVRESLAQDRPIAWQRVARVPDYVYFDHSIHVARGVACVECHGRVDEMALTMRAEPFQMRFCLDCHRDPAPALRPVSEITRMDWSDWARDSAGAAFGRKAMRAHGIDSSKLEDCNVCHR